MAINDSNRLMSNSITKLEKKNYATQVDETNVKSLSEQAAGTVDGKLDEVGDYDSNDLINSPVVKDHDSSLESLGQFGNPFCCKYPSLNVRLPKYKIGLDRDLDLTFNVDICGESKKINPIDYVMKGVSFVNQNPGILSKDHNTRLRALLSSDMVQKMNIAGLGTVVPDCILEKTGGFLSNLSSNYGNAGTMTTRRRLEQLVNKDKCARLVASQVGLYDFLSRSNQSHFINMIMDGDPTRAETYFGAVLGMEIQRISFMSGYSDSFREAYAYNQTYQKLTSFNTLVADQKVTAADKVYFNVRSEEVLDSLSHDETENKDIDEISKALDFISPDWDKDDDGNKNLFKTKDNVVLADLANNKLSTLDEEINLTGVYTTTLTNEHHISIINSFTE